MSRLLSFYGDDFTGSTDVMEAAASCGFATVLFTRIPTPSEFAPFANHAAIGLAGSSRSQSPAWMETQLPAIFAWLKSLQARFCHYKVCSTFDSSPTIGNIGKAAEIGAKIFEQSMVPLIVGAPQLKRYTFAGHLFANWQGEIMRIDRHPVMAHHPVTPMHEADLRLHLAKQSHWPCALANNQWPLQGLGLVDVHDAATQTAAGLRLLQLDRGFVVGSSGVEYALLAALERKLDLSHFEPLQKLSQIMVISGSVSPTSELQIKHACQHGFAAVPVSALALAQNNNDGDVARAVDQALRILSQGQSPIVHTALGQSTDESVALSRIAGGRSRIGEGLGRILRLVIERTKLQRVIVAGGDTSSHALGQLNIHALTTRMPLPTTPGSPLCKAISSNAALNGLEIALKGGQVGGDDYFVKLRN